MLIIYDENNDNCYAEFILNIAIRFAAKINDLRSSQIKEFIPLEVYQIFENIDFLYNEIGIQPHHMLYLDRDKPIDYEKLLELNFELQYLKAFIIFEWKHLITTEESKKFYISLLKLLV